MKHYARRILALLLSLLLCLSLTPATAMASGGTDDGTDDGTDWPSISITGTPELIGGGTPSLTMSWSYGGALPGGVSYVAEVYAWAGTSTTKPENSWIMTVENNTATSFSGDLFPYGSGTPETLSGDCMVQVELENYEGNVLTASAPVRVTATTPEPPTILEATFYNQYAPIGDGDEGTGAWYHFEGGSSNLEALALSLAGSKESTYDSVSETYGYQVDGQWYKVEGLYTVGESEDDFIDKGNGQMAVNAYPMSFETAPAEGAKLWLALWDYSAGALSNLVGITVPAAGTYVESGSTVVYPEAGTDEWKAAMQPRVLSVEVLEYNPVEEATGVLRLGISFDFPNLPAGGRIEELPGINGMHVITTATHPANSKTAQANSGQARLNSEPEKSISAISDYWDWAYASGGTCYTLKTFDIEPENLLVWSSGAVNGVAVGDALDISMTANGIIRDSSDKYVGSYATPNSASVKFTLADGIKGKVFDPSSTPTLTINTTSLPDATVGKSYSTTLSGTAANGGTLSWSRSSGSLPSGLRLNSSTGVISGTPTAVGESEFELTLSEAGGGSVTRTFTLRVGNPAPKITVTTLPNATKGLPYTVKLTGTPSGSGSLSWSLKSGTSLPGGLALATDGTISGTPTASGSFSFTVVLREENVNDTAEQALTLLVQEPRSYTASFNLNGGTAASGVSYADIIATENGTENWNTISLPAAPTRDGYVFRGWKSGYLSYQAGAELSMSADMSFIAQWAEPDPLKASYDGMIVGSYDLLGVREDGTFRINYGYNRTPASISNLEVAWSYLREYEFSAIELRGYVDGSYQTIAKYEGEPDADFELTPVAGMEGLKIISELAATDGTVTLTLDRDFSYSSLRCDNKYLNLPFMTTKATGLSAYIYGVSSSDYYGKYKWRTYRGDEISLSGSTATVTLEKMPEGFSLSGHVYFGEGSDTPLKGVQVQVTQYINGMAMVFSATTDESGAYSISGFQPKGANVGYLYYSVLSAGGTKMSEYNSCFENKGESGGTQTEDIHLNTALAVLELGLDLSDNSELSAAHRNVVRYGSPYSARIRLNDGELKTVNTGGTAYHYIYGVSANGEVNYEISGSGILTKKGSFTLSGGIYATPYREPILVKPKAGVVVALSSPTTCDYSLAWFKDNAFVGASDSFSVSGYTGTYYVPAPDGASGSYTVVLIPTTATGILHTAGGGSASTPAELGEYRLNSWTVSLSGESDIRPLSSYAISNADSEDAAYVTKPKSTMTADREAFSSTGDLVRFSGSIGLDAGLTEGKLNCLTINVRNDVDGISYSNTAPIQNMVVNGKLYGANDVRMSSSGYYSINGLSIDLPCDYTIYCKPGDIDWDMQINMYADVSYKVGSASRSQNSQLVGAATVKKPGASITTLSSYVCSDSVVVKGTAAAGGSVDIYDGETLIGSATANSKGIWTATVPLANVETPRDGITAADCYATTHILTSRTASGTVSDELYIYHDPSGPQLTSFRMGWDRWGVYDEIDVGDGYTYVGSIPNLTFKATFKNAAKLRETSYGDSDDIKSKVAFKYYLTNGTIGVMYADSSEDAGNGLTTFTASLPNTIYSSVTAADVVYTPILNRRPTETNDGVTTYALSETDLANAKTELDEAQAALNDSLRRNVSFSAVISGSGDATTASVEDTSTGEASARATEEELTAVQTELQNYAKSQAKAGITLRTFDVTKNDTDSLIKWMNDSAAEWNEIKDESQSGNANENTAGIYKKTMSFTKSDEYENQLEQLGEYATWQAALKNKDGSITGGQFVLSDAALDEDGNLSSEDPGTYIAIFSAYSDSTRGIEGEGENGTDGLYVINGVLLLNKDFTAYAEDMADGGLMLLEADERNDRGPALMSWIGDAADYFIPKGDSTLEKAVRNYTIDNLGGTSEGKTWLEKTLNYGGIDTSNILSNTLNNIKNYQESKEYAKEQSDIDRYIASDIESSKEWKEINITHDYYKDLVGNTSNSSFLRDGYGDIPTVQDRLNQIKQDMEAIRNDSGEVSWGETAKIGFQFASEAVGGASGLAQGNVGTALTMLKYGLDAGRIISDKIGMDLQKERQERLERLVDNWEYVKNWYDQNYGFGSAEKNKNINDWYWEKGPGKNSGGGSGGGTVGKKDELPSKGSSARKADDLSQKSKTKKPPTTNKVSNDPSGIVFEGVIENPVQGATVTLYYAAGDGGAVVKQDESLELATQLLRADDVDGLIPNDPVQITAEDGRYSWGVPEGLWYVSAQAGGMSGNSNADAAATIAKSLGEAEKLLPVLPVQLDVNIPLVDTSAPYVTDVVFSEGEGVYVSFSKYMKEGTGAASCLDKSNYTLKIGADTLSSFTLSSVDYGHYPANLGGGDDATFTKTVLLGCSALKAGDTVNLTVKGTVKSYADTPLGSDYSTGDNIVESQIKLDEPGLTLSSTNEAISTAEATVNYGDALILTLPATAPASAKLQYSTDNGSSWTQYRSPIVISSNCTILAKATAPGYVDSDSVSLTITVSGSEQADDDDDNNNTNNGGGSGGGGSAITVGLTEEPAEEEAEVKRPFVDVPENAWYYDAVYNCYDKGYFKGTDEEHFMPGSTMTRAMLVTVLYRLEGAEASGTNPFADVPDDTWYTDAVVWASSEGIVQGTNRGFDPDSAVTREQIATILYRYAGMLGLDTAGRTALDSFKDGDKTSSWAADAMQWAVSVGLFRGDDNAKLNPNGNATRAEVAVLLERVIELIAK